MIAHQSIISHAQVQYRQQCLHVAPKCHPVAFSARQFHRTQQGLAASCSSANHQRGSKGTSTICRSSADGGAVELQTGTLEAKAVSAAQQITNLFPLWVVLGAVLALIQPTLFTWIQTSWITWALAVTMLGMGLTMQMSDFTAVFKSMPALLCLGFALQYTVMPALGFVASRFAGLETGLATGMILLSACPGGTASNIVAFIAKGEMGLSIMMTTASTMAAVIATPLITKLLAGALVPVNAQALFVSTLQVVLGPVVLGVVLNQRFPKTVSKCARFTPALATLLVAIIVATTLAHSAEAARSSGLRLLATVAGLHAAGFSIGYWVSRMLGLNEKICRTNSIEVGMQNSTLGAVLASMHFTDPTVAVPCALSACTHAVMGSLLAAYWKDKPVD